MAYLSSISSLVRLGIKNRSLAGAAGFSENNVVLDPIAPGFSFVTTNSNTDNVMSNGKRVIARTV